MIYDFSRPTRWAGLLFIILPFLLWNAVACTPNRVPKRESHEDPVPVLVTVEPIAWLVERIGGDHVRVNVLVPAGKEAETFSPTPREVASFAEKRLFFRVGIVSEESLLPRLCAVAPNMSIIDLREGLPLLSGSCSQHHCGHDHDHGHHSSDSNGGHECGVDGLDPHFWMSPSLVRDVVKTIQQNLVRLAPSFEVKFRENAEQLDKELALLQARIAKRLAPLADRAIFVYHPAYGYYCREFGLEQCAIEVGGKSPKPQEMAAFLTSLKSKGDKAVIVQPEFGEGIAESIATTTGAKTAFHSPLTKDYMENLESLTNLIAGDKP